MSNSPRIFGAGLAGLIAARMLSDRKPVVYERQKELPNNHAALLRFRDNTVSLATNVPFQRVQVLKGIHGSENPVSDAVRYSKKVTGGYSNRSISNLDPAERYIAPSDLISRLASTANINFDVEFMDWSHNLARDHPPVISTIPMPQMMDIFEWKDKPEFVVQEGWTVRAQIDPYCDCNLNCTVYFPGDEPFYRASVTGRTLMVEGVGKPKYSANTIVLEAAGPMGLGINFKGMTIKSSKYQKIADLKPDERESAKRFIMWLSDKHNIHSLGRFATWRPKLLLDDIPNDVRVIARLIDGRVNYEERVQP